MKPARLLIAGIAGIAGLVVFLISGQEPTASSNLKPEATEQELEVLVIKTDIAIGTMLTVNDMQWVKWPREFANPSLIQRSMRPNAIDELNGVYSRQPLFSQEPVREDKLVKNGSFGYLAAVLPSGKRAMAITIDARGATSAGGFISPGDHVDVISTMPDTNITNSTNESYKSMIVLSNIRVLAIGQNIQEKNGERVVLGETATLELTPDQTETLTLLQRNGALALTLRSMADVNIKDVIKKPEPIKTGGSLTVLRYGVPNEVTIR